MVTVCAAGALVKALPSAWTAVNLNEPPSALLASQTSWLSFATSITVFSVTGSPLYFRVSASAAASPSFLISEILTWVALLVS